jgi:hypothetical protein
MYEVPAVPFCVTKKNDKTFFFVIDIVENAEPMLPHTRTIIEMR